MFFSSSSILFFGQLLLVLLVQKPAGVVAPFPPEHPYHFLNPLIDPWWHELDKEDQSTIYGFWEKLEPTAFALADAVVAKRRALSSLKDWAVAKKTHLHTIIKGKVRKILFKFKRL